MEPKLPDCRVLVRKLLECANCCFYTVDRKQLESHMQHAHLSTRGHHASHSRGIEKVSKPKKGMSNPKKFQCSVCQFKCRHQEILKWHTDNCHGDKPVVTVEADKHSCNICKKEFASLEEICSHMSSPHNINLPFQCQVCSKRFLSYNKLSNHKRTHSGTIFTCDECDAKYKSRYGLQSHKDYRVHTTQQVVKCDVCKKNYKSAQSLKIHKNRSHAKNRPFRCQLCFKLFSHKWQLNQHNRNSHLVGHLDCKICNMRFFTYKKYNMHQYYRHKNQAKYEYNTSPDKWYKSHFEFDI